MSDPIGALLSDPSFRLAGEIDSEVPDDFGVYAIRLATGANPPEQFQTHLDARKTRVIYIGQAERQTLLKRLLGNELPARANGTFFRSIGAVLGYRPLPGSLAGRKRTQNYRFTPEDRNATVDWIDATLEISWVVLPQAAVHSTEIGLIRKYTPLLNLAGNPVPLSELSKLRELCRTIASASKQRRETASGRSRDEQVGGGRRPYIEPTSGQSALEAALGTRVRVGRVICGIGEGDALVGPVLFEIAILVGCSQGEAIAVNSEAKKRRKGDGTDRRAQLAVPLLLNAPKVGNSARGALIRGVKQRGVAGTGTPIRMLRGIAADRAALARLGNGTLASGGRGIDGGSLVLAVVKNLPVVLMSVALLGLVVADALSDDSEPEATI